MRIRLAMRNRMFLFFSLVMPLTFLFGFALFIGKGRPGLIAYALGAVLTLTVMGSFWGLSVQLVTFREQGILRRFRLAPLGAGPLLASSILSNFFMALPTVAIEIMICRWVFHMQGWGNLGAHSVAGDSWFRDFFLLRPRSRQRDEYHAGNPNHQPADLDGLSVSFRSDGSACRYAAVDSARGPVYSGNLPCNRPRSRHNEYP